MIAGAVVETFLLPGIRTAVSAAISAGSEGKSTIRDTVSSNSRQVTQRVKQAGTAVLRLRRTNDGVVLPVSITCTTEIDTQIRYFQVIQRPSVIEISRNIANAFKGIKAFKELLNMGAISEEGFEFKKKQLLNS